MPLNIVLITDDQHRYDFVEMEGKFPVRTPALARLAREGIWHRHAYSPCALCMPARASLHNGLYAHQHGIVTNNGHWPFRLPTLPKALQGLGYRTSAIGKIHAFEGVPEKIDLTDPHVEEMLRGLGYDEVHEVAGKAMAWEVDCHWTKYLRERDLLEAYREEGELHRTGHDSPFPLGEEHYIDRYIADCGIEWLREYSAEQPFFLWLGLCSPHPPYDAPPNRLQAIEAVPPPLDNASPETGNWELKRRHYAAMTEIVDEQVGRVLDTLEEKGILDDTLVIFLSDHGEMLGDHDLKGKCWPHDPSIRVPLLARCPSIIETGSVSDAMVEITDVVATCLEFASGKAEATRFLPRSPARSLLPHWRDPQSEFRDYIYSEDGGQFFPPHQTVRSKDWKYSLYVRDGSETLFDMNSDPDECLNLAERPDLLAVKESLKTTLIRHLAATPAPQ